MKTLRAFILVLLSSSGLPGFACGFYPYGEDVRMCFFRPSCFRYHTFSDFDYGSQPFSPVSSVYLETDISPNEALWLSYCRNQVTVADVRDALGKMPLADIRQASPNAMVAYLFRTKNAPAIEYLTFAKNCELLNAFYDDPWERNQMPDSPQRAKLVKKARQFAGNAKDAELKLRYTFLAIRLAYYNGDFKTIRELYDGVYKIRDKKTVLDYWSLYFRTFAEINKPLANFYAAQVFANAPDKRFASHNQMGMDAPIEQVLAFAKTDQEKANVYLLKGIVKYDRALPFLKSVYAETKNFDGLNFLLLREINKLEDWIYTPYYTLFNPSVNRYDSWQELRDHSYENDILARVENDRRYAQQLLEFVTSVDISKVKDPVFWQSARAQLLFMTRQYGKCLEVISQSQSKMKPDYGAYNQLDMLKALCIAASQPGVETAIPDAIKPIVLKNRADNKFIFALGREFEYRGNTTDAVLFYSKVNNDIPYWEDVEGSGTYAYWGSYRSKGDTYSDYFDDYFNYINVYYTPGQMEILMADLHQKHPKDEFTAWEYSRLGKETGKLYDLLGTKYVRQNKLEDALASFRKVESDYWSRYYSAWERDNPGEYSYNAGSNIFDANPFYELKYTPKFIPEKDKYILTKTSVVKHLIDYIKRAENPSEKNRDYYYFIVANCYHNMTQYGNSWMLRRYYWSSSGYQDILEDEAEYFETNYARKYYGLAEKYAKTPKFKALCLWLQAKCENKKLEHYAWDALPYGANRNSVIKTIDLRNPYLQRFKKQYAADYEKLSGNCIYFEEYFRARR